MRTIQEIIDEQASEIVRGTDMITEMAVPLKKYKVRVDGLRFHLVRNWCLCRYCYLFDRSNTCFGHWIDELKAVIENLKFLNIKDKISKEKTLTSMLISDYDYNDPEMVKRIITDKFRKEKITDQNNIELTCRDFSNSIKDIIDLISNNNRTIDDYIEKNFVKK